MKNNTHNKNNIPEEILELLPWFAIGKLSADDHAAFEKALREYPSLQKLLKLEQQTINLVSADNSLLDKSAIAPTEERLKSVFNIIENSELQAKAISNSGSDASGSILEKLKHAFNSLVPRQLEYTRIASAGVLALSIVILSAIITPSQKSLTESSDFIPASAVTEPTGNQTSLVNSTKTILLVGFKGTAEELSKNIALKGKQIKIDSPADKDGFFQVSFKNSMNADEVKQTIDALLAQKEIVWFAGEAF